MQPIVARNGPFEQTNCVLFIPGTLYVGVTNNLIRRAQKHKNNSIEGFTKKYRVHILVWFEETQNIQSAIQKEKQIKEWKRKWKLRLIEEKNPNWDDLSELFGEG